MSNENTQVTEFENTEIVTRENDEFVVTKDAAGKFKRKAKFRNYSSIVAESREDKIWLANLIDSDDEDSSAGLKNHVGKQIEVQNIMTRTYDKLNEDTGELEYGVITYLITPDKTAYVTSSKSVYFKVMEHMELFGKPTDSEWQNLVYEVRSKKAQNGTQILIKLVG